MLRPDTEAIAALEEKLAAADRLTARKNQEIAERDARLAAAKQTIAERDEELERLESELSAAKADGSASNSLAGFPEAADLLNQLKARRKKSKAEMVDVREILEILEEELLIE